MKIGGTGTATLDLPAGDYVAYDIVGEGASPFAEFTVEGDEGDALPEPPAEIEDIETEKGASPIVESEAFDTAIVSGGESFVADLTRESGEYALLCFVPDREGGPPHALKGMVCVAPVE